MTINRNLKTLENKTGSKIKRQLTEMLDNHEKYKNTYFWSPPINASGRRAMEFNESIEFVLNGKKYSWKQDLSCSCRNVYWKSSVHVDGNKKNIRVIKKLIGA